MPVTKRQGNKRARLTQRSRGGARTWKGIFGQGIDGVFDRFNVSKGDIRAADLDVAIQAAYERLTGKNMNIRGVLENYAVDYTRPDFNLTARVKQHLGQVYGKKLEVAWILKLFAVLSKRIIGAASDEIVDGMYNAIHLIINIAVEKYVAEALENRNAAYSARTAYCGSSKVSLGELGRLVRIALVNNEDMGKIERALLPLGVAGRLASVTGLNNDDEDDEDEEAWRKANHIKGSIAAGDLEIGVDVTDEKILDARTAGVLIQEVADMVFDANTPAIVMQLEDMDAEIRKGAFANRGAICLHKLEESAVRNERSREDAERAAAAAAAARNAERARENARKARVRQARLEMRPLGSRVETPEQVARRRAEREAMNSRARMATELARQKNMERVQLKRAPLLPLTGVERRKQLERLASLSAAERASTEAFEAQGSRADDERAALAARDAAQAAFTTAEEAVLAINGTPEERAQRAMDLEEARANLERSEAEYEAIVEERRRMMDAAVAARGRKRSAENSLLRGTEENEGRRQREANRARFNSLPAWKRAWKTLRGKVPKGGRRTRCAKKD
jgi:hypothetical protein